MKKSKLTTSLLAALLLASPLVNAESKYPAADFKPEVIYQNPELVAKSNVSSESSSSSSASSSASSSKSDDGLSQNLPVIAIAAGLVVFMLLRKGSKSSASAEVAYSAPAAAAPAAEVGGETGVARYLKTVEAASETGVAKYVKGLEATASVAKETGVAKYLRERG